MMRSVHLVASCCMWARPRESLSPARAGMTAGSIVLLGNLCKNPPSRTWRSRGMHRRGFARLLALSMVVAAPLVAARSGASPKPKAQGPIQHVVFVMQENHSFDDVFGKFCAEVDSGQIVRAGVNDPCHGATTATLKDGSTRNLTIEPDYGLNLSHSVGSQVKSMDGGLMDGWELDPRCKPGGSHPYACLSQYDPLRGTCGNEASRTARRTSTRSQSNTPCPTDVRVPSHAVLGGHMVLGSASLEHFLGQNPRQRGGDPGGAVGWGCNAGKSSSGSSRGTPGARSTSRRASRTAPATWARWNGYSGTKADYVPTIFDSMDAAGVPWKTDDKSSADSDEAIGWSICPTFWECAGSSQAKAGWTTASSSTTPQHGLPAVSFVIPAAGGPRTSLPRCRRGTPGWARSSSPS